MYIVSWNLYSRFQVYEIHPAISSSAVGTRHCRVPTEVLYLLTWNLL